MDFLFTKHHLTSKIVFGTYLEGHKGLSVFWPFLEITKVVSQWFSEIVG
jgi:hypothetical protein